PTGDTWLTEAADFTWVFISGDSAGGTVRCLSLTRTIAHKFAVRFGSAAERSELGNVRVRGYVQLMPFFDGTKQTRSEADCILHGPQPLGSDSPTLKAVELAPTLVVVRGREILIESVMDYAARLRVMGKPVGVREFEG
ncbi:hypothetical protein ZWY2020_059974, partial [Hordeum vulgare]